MDAWNTSICIVDFSLLTFARLLFFGLRNPRARKVVHHGAGYGWTIALGVDYKGQRHLSALQRLGWRLIRLLGPLGYSFRPIPLGDDIEGFPEIELRARAAACRIPLAVIDEIGESGYVRALAKLTGAKEAHALFARNVGKWTFYFNGLLPVAVWEAMHKGSTQRRIMLCPPQWPSRWAWAVKETLLDGSVEMMHHFRLPALAYSLCMQALYIGYAVFVLLRSALTQGVSLGRRDKKRFVFAQEFTDPRRLNREPHDNDNLIDGVSVKPYDYLFYVTSLQEPYIKMLGSDRKQVKALMAEKGYNCVFLSELAVPLSVVGESLRFFKDLFIAGIGEASPSFCRNSAVAFRHYLSLAPLFHYYKVDVHIAPTVHEGFSPPRYESAVYTGLFRRNGAREVMYQTRPDFGLFIEFCYECPDMLLLWGHAADEAMLPYHRFVGELGYVGSYNPYRPDSADYRVKSIGEKVNIAAFLTDMTQNHFTTRLYSIRMLRALCRFALENENVSVVVKAKHPQLYNSVYASDAVIAEAMKAAGERFRLLDKVQYDNRDTIEWADIIVAQGYTTVGFLALLIGKRTVFYDEMVLSLKYLRESAIVAKDADELNSLLRRIVGGEFPYDADYGKFLDSIDPYRDGKTLERIRLRVLEAAGKSACPA